MATMFGADSDALDAAATQLDQAADQLDRSAGQLASTLRGLQWLGNVAVAFSDVWGSRHHPGMQRTAVFLRENAATLRRQARDQRAASGSDGAVGTRPGFSVPAVMPPLSPSHGRRDSEEERQSLMRNMDAMLKNPRYLSEFPDAMAKLAAWRAEFGDRLPTEAEAAQLERYLAAIKLANYQVQIVRDASELAEGEFAEMVKAGGSALTGEVGGEFGVKAAITGFAKDQIDGLVDSNVMDPIYNHVAGSMADVLAGAAAGTFDAKLAAMFDSARSTNVVMNNDPSQLAFLNYETSASAIEVARATGDIADAFNPLTGDGSVVDSLLRNGLKMVPGAGQVASKTLDVAAIAGASAQAGYHYEAGVAALDVVMKQMSQFDQMTSDVFGLNP